MKGADKLALGDFHIIKVNSTAFLPRHEELKRIIISFQQGTETHTVWYVAIFVAIFQTHFWL